MPKINTKPSQVDEEEKRKHPRYPVGLTLDIHVNGQSVEKIQGSISDLSVGGMTFRSNALLEEGASLHLKTDHPLEIRGEVRHIRLDDVGGLHRYGVRFHHIRFQGTERPKNFIAAKLQN